MRAAVFYGAGDIRVEEVPRPGAGEQGLIIKIRATGICGSDLHPYKLGQGRQAIGVAPGHETCGDVVEVGPRVSGVKVGDRVFAKGILPCFDCEWCRKGQYFFCSKRKSVGVETNGGFAEYVWIPFITINENAFILTPSMTYQDGALTEPVAVGTDVAKKAEPQPSDVVVIQGAGIIGLGALVKFKDIGVSRVIISDVSEIRLKAAKSLGADIIVNPKSSDLASIVMKETAGKGADIVVEAAGAPVTFLTSLDIIRRGGKLLLVAYYETTVTFDPSLLITKGIHLIPSISDLPGAFELIKAGKITAKQVVSHTFPLEKINEAYRMQMNAQESVKVMVEP